MSTSRIPLGTASQMPVSSFLYRQLGSAAALMNEGELEQEPEVTMTEENLRRLVANERAAATAEVEQRLRDDYERRIHAEALRMSATLTQFDLSRKEYFEKVETEVVSLALSIAGKILHRESQVDPLLLAAIVQIAVGQLKDGSSATLRVHPLEAARWTKHFDSLGLKVKCTVQADADLQPGDCMVETEIGSANFSLDAQLKEVERGFLDVLASRPQL